MEAILRSRLRCVLAKGDILGIPNILEPPGIPDSRFLNLIDILKCFPQTQHLFPVSLSFNQCALFYFSEAIPVERLPVSFFVRGEFTSKRKLFWGFAPEWTNKYHERGGQLECRLYHHNETNLAFRMIIANGWEGHHWILIQSYERIRHIRPPKPKKPKKLSPEETELDRVYRRIAELEALIHSLNDRLNTFLQHQQPTEKEVIEDDEDEDFDPMTFIAEH